MHGCFLSAATSRQLIDDLTTPKLPSHAQPAKIACTIAFASTTTAALPAVFRARARITTDGPFGSLGPQASRSALVSSPPLPPTTRLVVPYYRATGTRLLFVLECFLFFPRAPRRIRPSACAPELHPSRLSPSTCKQAPSRPPLVHTSYSRNSKSRLPCFTPPPAYFHPIFTASRRSVGE